MLKAVARREIDVVAAWSVDRLGSSLQDLLGFLGELHAKNVDLYLHQQGLDKSTPAGKALFQMMGVFAEFERAMIRSASGLGLSAPRRRARNLAVGETTTQSERPRSDVCVQRVWALGGSRRPSASASRTFNGWNAKP
jgi:DNA invertase Pin-like site-specific DNA recombinase